MFSGYGILLCMYPTADSVICFQDYYFFTGVSQFTGSHQSGSAGAYDQYISSIHQSILQAKLYFVLVMAMHRSGQNKT
jgi:hypothetical protein